MAYNSIVACLFIAAGMCLLSRCPETVVVYFTRHNTFTLCTLRKGYTIEYMHVTRKMTFTYVTVHFIKALIRHILIHNFITFPLNSNLILFLSFF